MDQNTSTIPQHVPLHLHTEYSLLDGATRIKDLVQTAKINNMPAVAITDHGVMYGALELYREAKKEGIKPIVGCEAYVVNGDHLDKSNKQPLYHLILLAKNDEGYINLSKIATESSMKGFYYKPRISKQFLEKHSGGLIAMTACLGGEVPNTILRNDYKKAREVAEYYQGLFKDDFYLEIQDHGISEEHFVIPYMKQLSDDLGINIIATNDSHFTLRSDAVAHDSILCLQTNKSVTDFPRMRFSGTEYVKNGLEMMSLFSKQLSQEDIKRAVCLNPLEVAEKISDYGILANTFSRLPRFPIPSGFTNRSYLSELVWAGVKERYGNISEIVKQRTDHELEVISNLEFDDYFLIVWDFIKFAKDRGIAVGPGRGSAAGSIVAYALGITDIDPIRYNLLFERFLNPERKSMPDIDTDFCIERRDEVLEYVRNKYGSDNVAQIITFNKLASRAVIKDISRVLSYPYSESEKIAKLIPVVRGKPRDLKWMKENHSEFANLYKTNIEVKQIVDVAEKLEGINKTFGVHAAGVVISDKPLQEFVPLSKNNDGAIITQYSMDDLAYLGLLKMDFLGLRNLTMINKALEIIARTKNIKLDLTKISLEDEKVFKMISGGDLAGVFQLETSAGMRQVAMEMKPSTIEDLSALIALYRPGPLDTGMIDEFIERKNGKKSIKYATPELKEILKDTYGSIVYQEQIMQIAQRLAGFSLGEADLLRKAMGKKLPKEMAKYRLKFVDGCKENKIDVKVAEELFDMMLSFAEYCFNKSHSAAYGMLTYQTAYMKANYPLEYLTALLSSVLDDQDKIKFYMAECRRLKIAILPPDINFSGVNFTCELHLNSIRFGLAAIKNVGISAVNEIIKARSEGGVFKSIEDFCGRVDLKVLNKKTLEALIKSGAFDSTKKTRKSMILSLEKILNSAQKTRSMVSNGQLNIFGDSASSLMQFHSVSEDVLEEFTPEEMQLMEKELTGFYISSHPFDIIPKLIQEIFPINLARTKEIQDGASVSVIAIISDFEKKLTKSKKIIGILELEDLTSKAEAVIFSDDIQKYEHSLVPEKLVIINGRVQQRLEGSTSIQVKSVIPLEELKVLNIEIESQSQVSSKDDLFTTVHSLKSALQQEKQSDFCPTVLRVVSNNGNDKKKEDKYILDRQLWIEPQEELLQKISKLFNTARINVETILRPS